MLLNDRLQPLPRPREAVLREVRREKAERVPHPLLVAVAAHLGQQVKQRRLAKLLYLWRELAGHLGAVALSKEAGANVTAAGPGRGKVALPEGRVEVRLIPHQHLAAGLLAGVNPLAQKVARGRMIRAGCANATPVREHLPGLGVLQRKARERLAGEDAGEPPRVEPHLEP